GTLRAAPSATTMAVRPSANSSTRSRPPKPTSKPSAAHDRRSEPEQRAVPRLSLRHPIARERASGRGRHTRCLLSLRTVQSGLTKFLDQYSFPFVRPDSRETNIWDLSQYPRVTFRG